MRYLTLALCAVFASLILFFSQSMAQIVVPTKMNVELQDLSKEEGKKLNALHRTCILKQAKNLEKDNLV